MTSLLADEAVFTSEDKKCGIVLIGLTVKTQRQQMMFDDDQAREEKAAELTDVVPFLVEDMLKVHGAYFTRMPDWKPNIFEDGLLITGQKRTSCEPAAKALLITLHNRVAVDYSRCCIPGQ